MRKQKPKVRRNYGSCAIESCENTAAMKESMLCIPCYNGMYYWTRAKNNKSPTDILRRQRQLRVYADRMAMLAPVKVRLVVNNKEKQTVRVR